MWNSLGSLRDRVRENANRVRENAKAAAQVAQGVLTAAAAEDDNDGDALDNTTQSRVDPTAQDSSDDWAAWRSESAVQQSALPPPSHSELISASLPLQPPPPPPPPPEDTAQPSVLQSGSDRVLSTATVPRGGRPRSSKYVVAGLAETGGGGVLPPRPAVGVVKPAMGEGFLSSVEGREGGEDAGTAWEEDGDWQVEVPREDEEEKVPVEEGEREGANMGNEWEGDDEWNILPPPEQEPAKEVDGAWKGDNEDQDEAFEQGNLNISAQAFVDGDLGEKEDAERETPEDNGRGDDKKAIYAQDQVSIWESDNGGSQIEKGVNGASGDEWCASVQQKSEAEDVHFWGVSDENSDKLELDGDWNVAMSSQNEMDNASDWSLSRKIPKEEGDSAPTQSPPELTAEIPVVGNARINSRLAAEREAETGDGDNMVPSSKEQEHNAFDQDGWEVPAGDQEAATRSDSQAFTWEFSQLAGSTNDDSVNWFSDADPQTTNNELAIAVNNGADNFATSLSKNSPAINHSFAEQTHANENLKAGMFGVDEAQSRTEAPAVENGISVGSNGENNMVHVETSRRSDDGALNALSQPVSQVFEQDTSASKASALSSNSPQADSTAQTQTQDVYSLLPTQESSHYDVSDADAATSSFSYHSDAETTALREEVKQLKFERSAVDAAREVHERDVHDLKQTVEQLQGDYSACNQDVSSIAAERDEVRRQLDRLIAEKMQTERERDAAIEQGGDGIREARSVIEAMRTTQNVTERREAVISEQMETLRGDLDRISEERNELLSEADELKLRLKDVEAQAKIREDSLKQQLQFTENENELARMERDKALKASQLHVHEYHELLQAEQATVASLAASESRVRELESLLDSVHRDRDDEVVRIEAFSVQVEDMKERTRSIIEERNALYDEKFKLQKEIEAYCSREEVNQRALAEVKQEQFSAISERDEVRGRYATLRDQFKETSDQLEAISSERDRLVEERTSSVTSSPSIAEKERALAEECQQKTAAMTTLRRKLANAMAKIEKLGGQKATYQRQRDEAGTRLRAAGAEFVTLNEKLGNALKARDKLQNDLMSARNERDDAFSQIQELSGQVAEKKLVDDSLENISKQLEDAQEEVAKAHGEIRDLNETRSNLQQKCATLTTDANAAQGRCEVIAKEKDMLQSQLKVLEEGGKSLQLTVVELESVVAESAKNQKSFEAQLATAKEKFALDTRIAKAELAAELKIRSEQAEKVLSFQKTVEQYKTAMSRLHDITSSSLESARRELDGSGGAITDTLECLNDTVVQNPDDLCNVTSAMISKSCNLLVALCKELSNSLKEVDFIRQECDEYSKKLYLAQQESTASKAIDEELFNMRSAYELAQQQLQSVEDEKRTAEIRCQSLEENLKHAESRLLELDNQLRTATVKMREELEHNTLNAVEERSRLTQQLEEARNKLESIWSMLQRSLSNYEIDFYNGNDYNDNSGVENVAVLVLRATASMVAELERNRTATKEIGNRLAIAEAEVARLTDRAELAEQERDAFRGANERLEKKAKTAHAEGEEAAKAKFETLITQVGDELDDTRQELKRVSDKAARSEKEAGELRALCSKLTSQLNGRTNELDEAEERVVYLQDQVTNLDEDLQEAHRRLKEHEEETAEARRNDVDRLNGELVQAIKQIERLETDCAQLREACDRAENTARESELLAETHRKAEANLQIATEQLEVAQESAVEERTIELHKKVQEAEERCTKAKKREEEVAMIENKLKLRDDEIKELRGAIGRLADERVELKLELEKSLSRLNHPDAGGQLVDRRVVRQLLVSYFRVGSLRRRDVLELMSRMLAFSEADNVAVGLKRRALMERIGSLVQPPELDDAQLPPLGTVSDKWIEFLMNETEEGEDQGKGW